MQLPGRNQTWAELFKTKKEVVPPKYSYAVYIDGNVQSRNVLDSVSKQNKILSQTSPKAEVRLSLTDVLLKEHLGYLAGAGGYISNFQLHNSIDSMLDWREKISDLCKKLEDATELDKAKISPQAFMQPLREAVQKAEEMVKEDFAFMLLNRAVFLDQMVGERPGIIPGAYAQIQKLEEALQSISPQLQHVAKDCTNALHNLSKNIQGIPPHLMVLSREHTECIRDISYSITGKQLNEAFADIVIPQVELRLKAFLARDKNGDVPLTAQMRKTYAKACQYIGTFEAQHMSGIERLGITTAELRKLNQTSFQHALLDKGFRPDQPVAINRKKQIVTFKEDENGTVAKKLATAFLTTPMGNEDVSFILRDTNNKNPEQQVSKEQVVIWSEGTKPFPAGHLLIANMPPHTIPSSTIAMEGVVFGDIRNGDLCRNRILYLPLSELDDYLTKNNIPLNEVLSVDMVRDTIIYPGESLNARELPHNETLDAMLRKRLAELAKEGEKMLPDLREKLFEMRHHESLEVLLKKSHTIKSPADITDDDILQVISPPHSKHFGRRPATELSQKLLYCTNSTRAHIATHSQKGPYGSVKFNSGEKSVFEMPIIEHQAKAVIAGETTAARAQAYYSGTVVPAHIKELERTQNNPSKGFSIFVSEDNGAKEDGHKSLEASHDGYIPTQSMTLIEFSVLQELLLRATRDNQKEPDTALIKLMDENMEHIMDMRQKGAQSLVKMSNKTEREIAIQAMKQEYTEAASLLLDHFCLSPSAQKENALKLQQDNALAANLMERFNVIDLSGFMREMLKRSQATDTGTPG